MSDDLEKKLSTQIKKYFIETPASMLYWGTLLSISDKLIVGNDWAEIGATRASGLVLPLFTSRPYNIVLDYSRKTFNPSYYAEIYEGVKREHTRKTKFRDYMVDTLTNAFYWNPIISGWALLVAGVSWEEAGVMFAVNTGWSFVAGRPYGKYMNWVRGLKPWKHLYAGKKMSTPAQ